MKYWKVEELAPLLTEPYQTEAFGLYEHLDCSDTTASLLARATAYADPADLPVTLIHSVGTPPRVQCTRPLTEVEFEYLDAAAVLEYDKAVIVLVEALH